MAFAGKFGPEESTPIAFFGWRREVGETERGIKGKRRMTKVEKGGMKKEVKGEGGREEAQRGVGILATNRGSREAARPAKDGRFRPAAGRPQQGANSRGEAAHCLRCGFGEASMFLR
jgi:hypothetical protein